MRFVSLAIVLSVIPALFGFPKWDALIVRWCYNPASDPEHCFQSIPLTTDEALASGWREVQSDGGCHNKGKFNGRRFVQGNNLALSPLYDVNGIIAGIQTNYMKKELFSVPNPFEFDEVPDYLDNEIEGRPVYSLTFYYINPQHVCSIGRSKRLLENQGTGTGIFMQTGPNPNWKNILRIPLYVDVASKHHWTNLECVPTMGHHNYYNVPAMSESHCNRIRMAFLVFNNAGELFGHGASALGNLTSPNFEHGGLVGVVAGLGAQAPECLKEHAVEYEISNMHIFFVKNIRDFRCKPFVQANHTGTGFINPYARQVSPWV